MVIIRAILASMRPPEFTGGNAHREVVASRKRRERFNEAAGIHRRKRELVRAIMRAEFRLLQ